MNVILVVGIATVDVVDSLAEFPQEDCEYRSDARIIRVGGNGANMARAIAQLPGSKCALLYPNVSPDKDPFAAMIAKQLTNDQVSDWGVLCHGDLMPMSLIFQCQLKGTRTIVHNRTLEEISYEQFSRVFTPHISWAHFEGRNAPELLKMLQMAKQFGVKTSIEMEKIRSPSCNSCCDFADVIIYSKAYIVANGTNDAKSFLNSRQTEFPNAKIVVTWGSQGAYFTDDGESKHFVFEIGARVVDSVGCGDVFNAVLISLLSQQNPVGWQQAVETACRVAALKSQFQGISGLQKLL